MAGTFAAPPGLQGQPHAILTEKGPPHEPTVVDPTIRPPRADAARPILHGWPQHWVRLAQGDPAPGRKPSPSFPRSCVVSAGPTRPGMATAPPSSRTTCSRCSTRSSSTGYESSITNDLRGGSASSSPCARPLARAPVDVNANIEYRTRGGWRRTPGGTGGRSSSMTGRSSDGPCCGGSPPSRGCYCGSAPPTPQPGPWPRLRSSSPRPRTRAWPGRRTGGRAAGAIATEKRPKRRLPALARDASSGGSGHDGARAVATLSSGV